MYELQYVLVDNRAYGEKLARGGEYSFAVVVLQPILYWGKLWGNGHIKQELTGI